MLAFNSAKICSASSVDHHWTELSHFIVFSAHNIQTDENGWSLLLFTFIFQYTNAHRSNENQIQMLPNVWKVTHSNIFSLHYYFMYGVCVCISISSMYALFILYDQNRCHRDKNLKWTKSYANNVYSIFNLWICENVMLIFSLRVIFKRIFSSSIHIMLLEYLLSRHALSL